MKASNRELERLLEGILATRSDLHWPTPEEQVENVKTPRRPQPGERPLADLRREIEAALADGAAAIAESVRLRRRSQRVRSAIQPPEKPRDPEPARKLSKREQEVLSLMVAGKSSKEIAAELGIAFKTAVSHRASIMTKLDVHEIASVVREAIRRGLV